MRSLGIFVTTKDILKSLMSVLCNDKKTPTFFGCVNLRLLSNEKGIIQLLLFSKLIRHILGHTRVCTLGRISNPGVQKRVTGMIQGLENKSSQSRLKESCLSDKFKHRLQAQAGRKSGK